MMRFGLVGLPAGRHGKKKKIVNVVIFFKYETLHKFSCIWCAVGRLFAE